MRLCLNSGEPGNCRAARPFLRPDKTRAGRAHQRKLDSQRHSRVFLKAADGIRPVFHAIVVHEKQPLFLIAEHKNRERRNFQGSPMSLGGGLL